MNNENEILFPDRESWRNWLEINHKSCNEIWVVYYKKASGKKSLSYAEGVEEALCFGWIDSLVRSIDNELYMQKYTPRRKNSLWSLVNKMRVEKLIQEGKMTEWGMKPVEEAKQNGKWENAYATSSTMEMPEDLRIALSENHKAELNFYNFPKSNQNTYIRWLCQAKREDTRARRIKQILKFAENNKKPGMN